MNNQTAMPEQVIGYDRNGLHVVPTGHVEIVAAHAAVELHVHAGRRALDVEGVVAFECIEDDPLDAAVVDKKARSEDALVGNDEVIAELGPHDGQSIKAIATFDIDR